MLVIQTLDFQNYEESNPATLVELAGEVVEALTTSGFMKIKNLGIEPEQVATMFSYADWFFSQDQAEKQRSSYASAGENFGFQGVGVEHLDPAQHADIKETFTMRDILRHDVTDPRWPNEDFREVATRFYENCLQGAYRIQRVCAHAFDLEQEFFVNCHQGENVSLRLLYYPASEEYSVQSGQLGAGVHTDYGMLTLLFQNGVGGLQVQDAERDWHDVVPEPDAIVINTGDLMERWTNGKFRSTPHRVQPKVGAEDRLSIAMFVDPDTETPVSVLQSCIPAGERARYPEITAGEHIQERIKASHRRGEPLA